MNKKKFLDTLKHKLRYLPSEDRDDALSYYEEYFNEMNISDEEDVILKFGSPDEVAREILKTCTDKHIEKQKADDSLKNNSNVLKMTLLRICAAPIAIPFIIALLAILFALIIAVGAIVISLFICCISFFASGLASCIFIILAPGVGQKLICIGIGLIMIGCSFIFLIISLKSVGLFTRLIALLFKKIFNRKQVN